MYILFVSKHPLYESGDSTEAYIERLLNPHFIFPKTFSEYSAYIRNIE